MFLVPTKYHQGFNFPHQFNLTKYLRLKNLINCQNIDSIKLNQRIGSERTKIYEAVFNDCVIAVKILKQNKQLKNETEINDRISNPDYFLFMIDSLECENKSLIIMELAISDLKQRLIKLCFDQILKSDNIESD